MNFAAIFISHKEPITPITTLIGPSALMVISIICSVQESKMEHRQLEVERLPQRQFYMAAAQ